MEAYLLDWANLLLRWAHIITGIAWIGSSFYFVSLDNSLTPPKDPKDAAKGVGGEQWGVHGGGFYHHQKYPVAPPVLPDQLHWSMWESYSTWLTGFALFTVLYLYNASTFLIDRTLFDWTPTAAIFTALAFFVAFWLLYDTICRTLGRGKNGDVIVGACVFVLIVFASWLSCHLFAGRAAFLLVGAMIATTMSGNVFFWIIPGQRTVVAAIKAGISLFTYGKASNKQKPNQETGIKLHAATGKVSTQSQSDKTSITADKTITVASINKTVMIAANKHVLLTAMGAFLKLEGGNITIAAPG